MRINTLIIISIGMCRLIIELTKCYNSSSHVLQIVKFWYLMILWS